MIPERTLFGEDFTIIIGNKETVVGRRKEFIIDRVVTFSVYGRYPVHSDGQTNEDRVSKRFGVPN